MTTVSDAFDVATMPGNAGSATTEGAGVRARVRARVAGTQRDGKVMRGVRVVRADVAGAWVWRDTPPSLAELATGRRVDADKVPAGHPGLRRAWTVYNHAVAIPTSAASYFLTWVVQHPARLLIALLILSPLVIAYLAG